MTAEPPEPQSDLVERLRLVAAEAQDDYADISYSEHRMLYAAADEIERLQAENDTMKFIIESTSMTAEQVTEWLKDFIPVPDGRQTIEDGFGSTWACCSRDDCGLEVVRPGKVQCWCDTEGGRPPEDDAA